MPDRMFLYAQSDVETTLRSLIDNGFLVYLKSQFSNPVPVPLALEDLAPYTIPHSAIPTFSVYQPHWIRAPLHTSPHTHESLKGKYWLNERINAFPINLTFWRSQVRENARVVDWGQLFMPTYLYRPMPEGSEPPPPDAAKWFRRIQRQMFVGGKVETSPGRFYYLCKGLESLPREPEVLLPWVHLPFDFALIEKAKLVRLR